MNALRKIKRSLARNKAAAKNRTNRRPMKLEALEPRLMLDGSPFRNDADTVEAWRIATQPNTESTINSGNPDISEKQMLKE
jgi:hypothetical protein